MRLVEIARGAWGLVLLVDPSVPLRVVRDAPPDARAVAVARVLGARHVVQAGLSGVAPTRELLAIGVWVDTAHAVTALGLAVADPSRARLALTDAAVAATFAGIGLTDLTTASPASGRPAGWQTRWAAAALRLLPGGRFLLDRGQ